jgi:hypothetical protein
MNNPLARLHHLLVERYNLSDLRALCFELSVNYDELPGETLGDKARELILRLGRRKRLEELLVVMRQRPDLADEPVLRADPDGVRALYAALPAYQAKPAPARPARNLVSLLLSAVMVLAVLVAVYFLVLSPSGEPEEEAPHAPAIPAGFAPHIFDEKRDLLQIGPGERALLDGRELWSSRPGGEASCATGVIALNWQVRQPYPEGGDELELERAIPFGGGSTEVFARGARGTETIGYCDEITLFNASLVDYTVEIRYASGLLE